MPISSPKVVVLDIDYQYLINRHDESILFHQVYNGYPDSLLKVSYFFSRIAKEEYRGAFLKWTNYWQCYYMIAKKEYRPDPLKLSGAPLLNYNPNLSAYDGLMGGEAHG